MEEPSKALLTASLPQYQMSPMIMERLIDAALAGGGDLRRSQNVRGAIKAVEPSEISADALDYFLNNKAEMETEFRADLTEAMGTSKCDWFCDVVANDWYDGRGLRNGPRVMDLKRSVRDYLKSIGRKASALVQRKDLIEGEQTLTAEDVSEIIQVNHQMMIRHIEAWKSIHPESATISNDDVFFTRGLSLKEPLPDGVAYVEWDYINSYSLAFSAPEQFAQMLEGGIPALVHGDWGLFEHQVLFFSPWVPGMPVHQLELGIIPQARRLVLTAQDEHGGFQEYRLKPEGDPL